MIRITSCLPLEQQWTKILSAAILRLWVYEAVKVVMIMSCKFSISSLILLHLQIATHWPYSWRPEPSWAGVTRNSPTRLYMVIFRVSIRQNHSVSFPIRVQSWFCSCRNAWSTFLFYFLGTVLNQLGLRDFMTMSFATCFRPLSLLAGEGCPWGDVGVF